MKKLFLSAIVAFALTCKPDFESDQVTTTDTKNMENFHSEVQTTNSTTIAADLNHVKQGQTNYFIKAVSPELRTEFAGFIDNVLRIVPSKKFFEMVDSIAKEHTLKNDLEMYKQLLKSFNTLKHRADYYSKLKALWHQKAVLSQQIQQLIGEKQKIDGVIEIGSPSTYTSTLSQAITGDVYVINDQQNILDRVQCGGRKPNNKFVPLNNYEPISEDAIPSNSVDLVMCFIGLHHCPKEKLTDFIASIARILRPGGVFILRDHDAHNDRVMAMAHGAHSAFNAIMMSASLETERDEYRNFQPITYWLQMLEENGFCIGKERLLQDGDPSLNTLIKCTKNAITESEKLIELEHAKLNDNLFTRPVLMSQDPEWVNVDLAKEYAFFLNHTPWYNFPYCQSVKAYWRVFGAAWNQARKKHSLWRIINSDAMKTNATVGMFTTIEFLAKGLAAYPVRILCAGNASLRVQAIIKDPQDQINTVDSRIKVLEVHEPFKIIELPRYSEFLDVMQKLLKTEIEIENIAGQKAVSCKVRYRVNGHDKTEINIAGCTQEYTWTLPTQRDYEYATYFIPVKLLRSVMATYRQKGIEMLYIHESRDA